MTKSATAQAHPNIAFIKYWGNRDDRLRLPENSSISMNLDGLFTRTGVTWTEDSDSDELLLNGIPQSGGALTRVSQHLTMIRERTGIRGYAKVESSNNFPMGAGIASSASSSAALAVAAVHAAGLELSERELTTLARLGSGSAARSVPSGFVEWYTGETHDESYAESMAAPDYWDLVDVIAVVSTEHKDIGSTQGHQTAKSSPLQNARVESAKERFAICKSAILNRDFATFANIVELDSNIMHGVMMTSTPRLFYWFPTSLIIMREIPRWRSGGLQVCYTLDAGPNVHCICLRNDVEIVSERLKALSGVMDIKIAGAGVGAVVISSE
jgi:diphosphomevalonate decarboxylase